MSNEDQNQAFRREHPYRENLPMVIDNIKCAFKEPEKSKVQRWLARKTMDDVVSFQQLQEHPNDNYTKKLSIGVLVSITTNSNSESATVYQRGGRSGQRGNTNKMRWLRMLRISCIKSQPGHNTVTFLEGCGHGARYFSADVTSRDDGTIGVFVHKLFYLFSSCYKLVYY